MKQSLIYGALFAFALSAAAPMAMAGDHHDQHQDKDRRSMDSGAYDADESGAQDRRNPTDPRYPSTDDGSAGGGTGTGSGVGAGGAATGAPDAGAGAGPGIGSGR